MSRFEELQTKVNYYKWLKSIANNYHYMIRLIESEKDFFTIYSFSYAARGDVMPFNVNPHRTIPSSYIKQGLEDAVMGIEQEMKELETELKDWL